MDPIDEFVRLFLDWMDRTGAVGNPDLELIRDLLQVRREVQDVFGVRDDMGQGVPGVMVWPNQSLFRTVLEVAPFSFPIDRQVREALVRTLPLLRDFIRMSLTKEREDTIRQETADLLDVLTTDAGPVVEHPGTWALRIRRLWLQTDEKFEPPDGEAGESWSDRFGRLPWERRNELVGPILQPLMELPGQNLYGDTVVPRPTITLPSTLVAAARTAPLMADVIAVAEFLADRTGIWSGGRLADDVVQQVLDGTTLLDPEAVQEAWRLAVLAGFLWPVPIRVFRGERLDLWSDPEHAVDIWTDVVWLVLSDLADPLRSEGVRLMRDLYFPGPDKSADQLAAVRTTAEGRALIDRLLRMGAIAPTVGGGAELTPLGVQGLLFRWTNWKADGGWRLEVDEWRPDLTTADLLTWLRAFAHGRVVDKAGAGWVRTADPQVFARQLVDAMLASDDGVNRAAALVVLSQLGSSVTPMLDRLVDTPLHAYRAFWPSEESVREPRVDEVMLWMGDYLAFSEPWVDALERLEPGAHLDLGNFDLPVPGGDKLMAKARQGGQLTAAEIAELRQRLAQGRAEFTKAMRELTHQ